MYLQLRCQRRRAALALNVANLASHMSLQGSALKKGLQVEQQEETRGSSSRLKGGAVNNCCQIMPPAGQPREQYCSGTAGGYA